MQQDIWRYLLFRCAAAVVPHLDGPRGYLLFARLADGIYLAAPRTRGLVQRNLAQALGPHADPVTVRRLARRVFRNLLWNYYEMFHLPAQTVADLRARITLEGTEHGEAALRSSTAAIFVFPHISNLEILMQIALLYPQYRFQMLVERMQDEQVYWLMRTLRGCQGVQIVATDEMLRIMRLFRQGWTLVLAGDLDSTGSGVVVDFFGAPARMPDGAVRLALRTGAPLLIVYGWREPVAHAPDDGPAAPRFRLRITPPVSLARTGDPAADVQRGVQDLVGRLEEIIAAHLDQWLAFHPIWLEESA